jgi:hypothetical protein
MHSGDLRLAPALAGLLVLGGLGCNSLAEVDVKCGKLCLTAPGPTVPGSSGLLPFGIDAGLPAQPDSSPSVDANYDAGAEHDQPVDSDAARPVDTDGDAPVDGETALAPGVPDGGPPAAALDAGLPNNVIDQMVPMQFNLVLEELPGVLAGLDVDVRLLSIEVTGATDLAFIDAMDIVLFAGKKASRASGDAEAPAGSMGAGLGTVGSDGGLLCDTAGLLVASYRSPSSRVGGTSIALTVTDPTLNLYSCLKSAPANFDVRVTLAPDALPASDVPLNVTTCVSAHVNARWP